MKIKDSATFDKTHSKSFVKSIGIELECTPWVGGSRKVEDSIDTLEKLRTAVKTRKYSYDSVQNAIGRIVPHAQPGSDGSIHVDDDDHSEIELRIWDTVDNGLKNIFDVLKFCYDDWDVTTNDTCGFHMHVRFNSREVYGLFTYKKVYDKWIRMYTEHFAEKPKYLDRLTNIYCKKGFNEDGTIQLISEFYGTKSPNSGGLQRYNAINMTSLEDTQKTIEFRVFPRQENFKEAQATILWFVDSLDELINETINEKGSAAKAEVELAQSKGELVKGNVIMENTNTVNVKGDVLTDNKKTVDITGEVIIDNDSEVSINGEIVYDTW